MVDLGFGSSTTEVWNYTYKIILRSERKNPFNIEESLEGRK